MSGAHNGDDLRRRFNQVIDLHNKGRSQEAIPLAAAVCDDVRKTPGDEDPICASCLNNLAELYREVGDFRAAEPLYRQVLEIRRKTLGEEHPAYAKGLHNLAELYRTMGNDGAAKTLDRQVHEIRRKALGEEYPHE